MMAATVRDSAVNLGAIIPEADARTAHIDIYDFVADSRDVHPGAAFVALAGNASHGLDYLAAARAAGAAVVLYDPATTDIKVPAPSVAVKQLRDRLGSIARRFYGAGASRPTITGITGTNGKTTVAWLLAQALAQVGRTAGYIGTLGFGVPPQLTNHRLTTPDCLTLHREIALMPVADVALEVSSHGLAQDRLAGVDVSGAIFTNLSHDHLDAHGTMQAYADTKAQLFRRPELEHGVINMDDSYARRMRGIVADSVRLLGIGSQQADGVDLFGKITRSDLAGLVVEIDGTYGSARIESPLIGEFNATNLLLSLGAMVNLDIALADACEALGHCTAPPGRMEVFGGGKLPQVIVDYAHTPDALGRALAAVRTLTTAKIWCVFGCGGERDQLKREPMGAAAGAADRVVLTDDNPRGEDPAEIVAAIQLGLSEHPHVLVEHDRERAIEYAINCAGTGDVVLIAGRGHETRQLRRGDSRDLDDREVVARILGEAS